MRILPALALLAAVLSNGSPVVAQDPEVMINSRMSSVTVQTQDGPVTIMRNQDTEATIDPAYAKTSRKCPPFCIQPMQVAPGSPRSARSNCSSLPKAAAS